MSHTSAAHASHIFSNKRVAPSGDAVSSDSASPGMELSDGAAELLNSFNKPGEPPRRSGASGEAAGRGSSSESSFRRLRGLASRSVSRSNSFLGTSSREAQPNMDGDGGIDSLTGAFHHNQLRTTAHEYKTKKIINK